MIRTRVLVHVHTKRHKLGCRRATSEGEMHSVQRRLPEGTTNTSPSSRTPRLVWVYAGTLNRLCDPPLHPLASSFDVAGALPTWAAGGGQKGGLLGEGEGSRSATEAAHPGEVRESLGVGPPRVQCRRPAALAVVLAHP